MAREAPYRQGELNDVTKTMLSGLAQHEDVDTMIAFLNGVKEARSGVRANLAVAVKPAEGVERFEAQYAKALAALTSFGIETKGAPSWEQIKAGITPEQLRSVEHMSQPTLVLTPPMSRHQMVQAVNAQKGKYGIQHDTYTYNNVADDALYNDGKPEGKPTWEVNIVEGVTDVSVDEALQMRGGKFRENHEQVSALLKDLKGKGLEALSGARNYLAAMMNALTQGQPIDVQNWTVLNANTVDQNPNSLLGGGYWGHGRVVLSFVNPGFQDYRLRLRGAVRVKL